MFDLWRVGLSEGVRIRALGLDILLATERPAVRDYLQRDWARCVIPEGEAVTTTGPQLEISVGELPEPSLGYHLTTLVTRQAIEASIGRLLMFHAAGLADAAGRVLMLVAPSGTGKTTAAAALGRSAWGYVTDETVGITADLEVLPYPKPLSVLDGPGRKTQRSPDDLELCGFSDALQIHRVVLLARARGAYVAPSLDRIGLLDGLLELIPQTSSLFALDRPLQRLCELSAACSGILRLSYSDIRDAECLLAAQFKDDATPDGGRPIEPWVAVEDVPVAMQAMPSDGRLLRAPFRDAIEVAGEGLVLVGSVPIRLGPLGLTLWRASGGGATEDELFAAAVREHGPHPGAAEAVRAALTSMLGAGLLRASNAGAL